MLSKNNLQKKLLSSVCLIVTIAIILITALVTIFEKNRFQHMEFNRIYYETQAIKKKLGHLISVSNRRYLMRTLTNAKAANHFILYFALTDINNSILVCDDGKMIGKNQFEKVVLKNITTPLFEASHSETMDEIPSRFKIFQSQLTQDFFEEQTLVARKNERILDTFWDIIYGGEKVGTLRIGFSRQGLKKHLIFLIGGMLGTGFFVLIVTLGLIFMMIKKSLKPMDCLRLELKDLHNTKDPKILRQKLGAIQLDKTESDVEEIQELKQAFSKIRDLFILNWDQLENHRNNLEEMVKERTRELHTLNKTLTLQVKERKQIEARLLNAQKLEAVGTLAGGIAHEFNNLFMAITGYASLIQKQSEPGHPNAVKAEKIRDLVDNGSQSIKQLLGFARNGKYDIGPLNINEIIRVSLEMFKRTRKDIEIVTKFTQGIWNVSADRSQMEHIVMNLLLNASEAMPDKGRITIETNNIVLEKKRVHTNKIVSGKFVHFSIKDEGKGIEKKYIQRIFDPFFTTKSISSGTGLGLASVYGIVDNHDGFTSVESTVAKGTGFSVFLPVAKKGTQ
ncbi:MAG: hypothetical protein KKD66_07330 [Proteobacteria bacterium]|nr:hypothetical protein [Pseudomonadota bacterium]MBU2454290.1 hypothetical protein [Pseudomonadota bacterium]MBU2629015.1 hypothetical protein [Pseudomonadota bacterium]